MRFLTTFLAMIFLAACPAEQGDPPKPEAPVAAAPAAPAPTEEGKEAVVAPTEEAKVPSGATRPVIDVPDLELCKSDWRIVARYDFEALQAGKWHKLCCEEHGLGEEYGCDLDWPSSDVMMCKDWARMRNTVFAAHGYVFKKDEWKAYFAKVAWYSPDPTFDPSQPPEVARKNVKAFRKQEKNCLE